MEILKACGGVAQTNCWLIADEVAKQAVLFDAPNDTTAKLLDDCQKRGWDLIGLWLTHGHFDHLADHAVVSKRFPKAKVLLHKGEEDKMTGEYPVVFPLPFVIPPRKPDAYLSEGQELRIGSIKVQVMHTPGHAAGHVVFYLPEEKVLVGGDMILCGAIGRVDLPDSDYDVMCQSIRRIMDLPEETTLLPGHCGRTTLGRELASNCMVKECLSR
jgi:glyoxylase-like metal-dependent hydrolase (beta-lactamase superfamily II)